VATDPRPAVRVRVVAPVEYARVWQVVREQVAQPFDVVDAVACRPRLPAVLVQAVDCDDARVDCVSPIERRYGYKAKRAR
jgi:hypothetical protein